MLVLLVRGVWILFAIRVLGWRSTISNRTFLTYLSLGAFIYSQHMTASAQNFAQQLQKALIYSRAQFESTLK
jgi:hypothetical protein